MTDKTPEFAIQRTIRRKVIELAGELDLLKTAMRHLMTTHGTQMGRWDMEALEHEINEAHSSIGQAAFVIHSFGPEKEPAV